MKHETVKGETESMNNEQKAEKQSLTLLKLF